MEDQIKEINKKHKQLQQKISIIKENTKVIDDLAFKHSIEIWKIINGFENYNVSSKGRVKNNKSGRILKCRTNCHGYLSINLYENGKRKTYNLHRLVANAFIKSPENKKCVDHVNNMKLDNNANNLRFATLQENQFNRSLNNNNSSGQKGIYYHKKAKKWIAYIRINNKSIHIGNFDDLEKAKQARIKKANESFGEFKNACEN